MDLENIAHIAEIASSIAVIVSLIYVGVQVRQNTRALKATTYNAATANSLAILAPMYSNAEFTEFLSRAQSAGAVLTPAEKLRFHMLLLMAFRHWDNLYFQFRSGALDPEMWQSYDRTMNRWFANQAWRDWFRNNAECFSATLRELVRDRLDAPGA
jgi:hypothetical protein